jgi:hypothetical protein
LALLAVQEMMLPHPLELFHLLVMVLAYPRLVLPPWLSLALPLLRVEA